MRVLVPTQVPRAVKDRARFPAEPLFGDFDEDELSQIALGPGDSHYEWSFSVDGFDDDSQVDVPAFVTPEPEPKQVQAASKSSNALRVASREWAGARSEEPQQIQAAKVKSALAATPVAIMGGKGQFVAVWSRYQLVTTLGFGAAAFLVLGFLLLNTSVGGHALTPATSTLVVGFLGAVAFVLLSLTALALNFVLIEVARDLRRLQNDLEGP